MAPYGGPSIPELVVMFRKPKLEYAPTLGFGLPRAPLHQKDDGFELHRLSGGEGFGVQADLVEPFVDEGVIVKTSTWQEMIAWLCEHWESDWGPPFKKGERLAIKSSSGETTVHRLADAAAACRAATKATLDFDAVVPK